MARRATLELLRLLRRRDARARARQAATTAEQRVEADRAAENAAARRSVARAEYDDGVRAETAHLDAGAATAGDLARAHRRRVGAEERVERVERDAAHAAERAAHARRSEKGAFVALEQALTAESRVAERIADGARAVSAHAER